ncbi:MAG: hypothetical protein ABIC40_00830, partial [bacterium]
LLTVFLFSAALLVMIASCAADKPRASSDEQPVKLEIVDKAGEVNAEIFKMPGFGPIIRCKGDKSLATYEDTPSGWGPTVYLRNVRFAKIGSITLTQSGEVAIILDKDDWLVRDTGGATVF